MEIPTEKRSVGDQVIFSDPLGRDHPALVTAVWSETCVNLVFVSGDETRKDQYGRQLERQSSCVHGSQMHTHGNYWYMANEEPNPIAQAVT